MRYGDSNENWILCNVISRCSKCDTPVYGHEMMFDMSISNGRAAKYDHNCKKCGHVDPAFAARTYGLPMKHMFSHSPFINRETLPWWSKTIPLWTLKSE